MPLHNLPIRRKLMTIILLTSGVVSLLTCAAFFAYDFLTFRQSLVAIYTIRSQIIATNSTAALAFENEADAREVLSALRADPHVVAAGLYDRNGRWFARYPTGRPDTGLPLVPGVEGFRFEGSRLVAVTPVVQGARRLGTLYLQSDLTALTDRFQRYALIVILVMALSFGVAYPLTRVLQRQVSQPILALADTARAVAGRRDYSVRATKQGNDEIGLLTDAFNQMLGEIQTLHAGLERRVAERTAQLEAANAELEAFSYSVSHDLRAPLRHVQGYVEMLARESQAQLSDKARRYLKTISDAAREMGELIDDLLAFSRMGRTEMREAAVDLPALIEDTRRGLEPASNGRDIRWKTAPLPAVRGDAAMLRQVLVNLLGNAVKYTRARQPAEIEIGCAGEEEGRPILYVRDNGAGFDMKYADKLFAPFQRLHSSSEFPGEFRLSH